MSKTKDLVIETMNENKAIIVDIDGTLSDMCNRSPYEYHKAVHDNVHEHIAQMVRIYRNENYRIILLSGRDEECKDVTLEWLDKNDIPYDGLFMRVNKDRRKDSVVKLELYKRYVQGNYDVKFVLDDRNQVVDMWRSIGLPCLQVAPGDF